MPTLQERIEEEEELLTLLRGVYRNRITGSADIHEYTVGGRSYRKTSLVELRKEIDAQAQVVRALKLNGQPERLVLHTIDGFRQVRR